MANLSVSPSTGPVADNFLYTWGSNTSSQLGDPTLPQVAASWSAISGGRNHTLGIRDNGTLWAWGSNASGQLGDGTTVTSSTPLQIGTDSNWSKIVTGVASSYAIKSNGALYAWGSNNNGQLGDGTTVDKSSPVQLGSDSWTLVDAGELYMHAIRSDGTLWGSGLNTAYQLGDGTAISKSSPVQIGVGTSWIAINSGDSNAMAISSSDKLYTWGTDSNQTGYLGQLSGLRGYSYAAGSTSHTAAIASDGTLWGWGLNSTFQLGLGDSTYRSYPAQIASGSWSKVAVNNGTTVAIKSDGTMWVAGTTGPNAGVAEVTLTQLGTDTDWVDLSITQSSTTGIGLALKTNGKLYAWTSGGGTGSAGNAWALGVGATNVVYNGIRSLHDHLLRSGESWTAFSVGANHKLLKRSDGTLFASGYDPAIGRTSVKSWSMISSGQSGVMGIDSQGRLYSWGRNTYGQLGKFDAGLSATASTFSYPSITNSQSWTHVTVQNYTTLGILANGELWGFGRNTSGELMTTVGTAINSPTLIHAGPWSKVEIGRSHVMALKTDGTLWTWGVNTYGQLGTGNTTSTSSPTQIGTSTYTEITGGLNFSLAIRSDGTLWSWGGNSRGQLGRGNTTNTSSPVQVGTASWSAVSAGPSHVMAIRSDGLLFGWGFNTSGQLGDGTVANKSAPVQIGNNTWSKVRGGGNQTGSAPYTQAIRSDGTLWGWGDSGTFNVPTSTSSPVQIGSDSDWVTLGRRWGDSSAAMKTNGLCYVWGSNAGGQVGDGTTNNNSVPTLLGGNTLSIAQVPVEILDRTFDKIYAGGNNLGIISYGIDSLGKLWAWGSNDTYYLLGNGGAVASTNSPVQIGVGTSWTSVGAGAFSTMAIDTTGRLHGWGEQLRGQLMNGSYLNFTSVSVPTLVNSDTDWTWINTDGRSSRAGKSNTYMYTAGYNLGGRLGIGKIASHDASVPTLVGNNTIHQVISPVQLGSDNWSKIGAGKSFSTAIKSDSTLWTWGLNNLGQLGLGDTINRNNPVQVGTATWKEVSAGMSNAAAIKSDDTAWIWGSGSTSQLATGDTLDRSSPVQIGSNTYQKLPNHLGTSTQFNIFLGTNNIGYIYDVASTSIIATATGPATKSSQPGVVGANSWTAVSAGASHIAAIRSDYTLWAWGANDQYQLGLGDTTTRSSPVQIGTSSWTAVSAGQDHTVAINSLGRLYAWGKNNLGQVAGPAQPATFTATANGGGHALAVGSDGKLWTWGIQSDQGQLGTGSSGLSNFTQSSPAQVGSATNYQYVSAGNRCSYAIRTDGTLWTWGENQGGQLGLGDTTNRSTPTQVAGSWTAVNSGNQYAANGCSFGIKSDGTLWAWGTATGGILGAGATTSSTSPIQISSDTNWLDVDGSILASGAIKTDGTLWTWGLSNYLGDGTSSNRSSPVQIGGILGRSFVQIVGLGRTMLALASNGELYCWGETLDGTSVDPISKVTSTSWTAIGGAGQLFLGIQPGGSLWAWGATQFGSIGDAAGSSSTTSPIQIASGVTFSKVPKGHGFTALQWGQHTAISTTNKLYGWNNALGLAFSGNLTSSATPVEITTITGSTQESAYISPVAVSGATGSWTAVSAGASHSAAIKTNGTLWTWGSNDSGRLGLGDTTNRSSPVQVGTSSWAAVSAGAAHTLGIKSDGTLAAWGSNSSSQVAVDIAGLPPTSISSPVAVSGATGSWTVVSAGTNHSMAIKSDGKLYAWGGNASGQLGNNSTSTTSSAVLIGSASWAAVSAGNSYTVAVNAAGKLFAWGVNATGQLGDASLTTRSSPVQIGTATWNKVDSGGAVTVGIS